MADLDHSAKPIQGVYPGEAGATVRAPRHLTQGCSGESEEPSASCGRRHSQRVGLGNLSLCRRGLEGLQLTRRSSGGPACTWPRFSDTQRATGALTRPVAASL